VDVVVRNTEAIAFGQVVDYNDDLLALEILPQRSEDARGTEIPQREVGFSETVFRFCRGT